MLALVKHSELEASSPAWLYQFWEYMNPIPHLKVESMKPEILNFELIHHFPLVLVRDHCGTTSVKSLNYFQNDPVVLQSTVEKHVALFSDFPDLFIADSRTMPDKYREAEKSLSDPSSMKRFLKSIATLAQQSGKGFTEYVRENLSKQSIKVC